MPGSQQPACSDIVEWHVHEQHWCMSSCCVGECQLALLMVALELCETVFDSQFCSRLLGGELNHSLRRVTLFVGAVSNEKLRTCIGVSRLVLFTRSKPEPPGLLSSIYQPSVALMNAAPLLAIAVSTSMPLETTSNLSKSTRKSQATR